MKKIKLLLLCCLLATFSASAAPITGKHTFEVGKDSFLLDDKPFVIRCGEMHFARIPRDLWRHRIQMVRACGFNAVCAFKYSAERSRKHITCNNFGNKITDEDNSS